MTAAQPAGRLREWVRGRSAVVSIDTDFFADAEERDLLPLVQAWLAREAPGVPTVFRTEHVDLVGLVTRPVDVVVNLDYHLDCRIEYLHGDPPKRPPCSASVFETLLSDGLVDRYVWAFPAARAAVAARVYASALLAQRQPVLPRIHCLPARDALAALSGLQIRSVFVCSSPAYATAATNDVYDRLRSTAGG